MEFILILDYQSSIFRKTVNNKLKNFAAFELEARLFYSKKLIFLNNNTFENYLSVGGARGGLGLPKF